MNKENEYLLVDDKTYKEICYKIWGCVPVDKNWAINTNIFQEALTNLIK